MSAGKSVVKWSAVSLENENRNSAFAEASGEPPKKELSITWTLIYKRSAIRASEVTTRSRRYSGFPVNVIASIVYPGAETAQQSSRIMTWKSCDRASKAEARTHQPRTTVSTPNRRRSGRGPFYKRRWIGAWVKVYVYRTGQEDLQPRLPSLSLIHI